MTSNPAPAKPEPSATLVLVRDSDAGLEVFLQQRHHNIPFLGGAHVFPGGKVEASDHDPRWRALSSLTEQHANAVLGVDAGGLSYWVAAIRECYEESGILMARQSDGTAASPTQLGGWPVADFDFLEACETAGLQLCTEQLIYYAHWITPAHLPKRFDTRFFIARAPTGQTGAHDGYESIDSLWISAQNALQMEKERRMTFAPPTFFTLKYLLDMKSVDELISHAENNKPTRAILPIFRNNRLLMPDDPGYDEAAAESA